MGSVTECPVELRAQIEALQGRVAELEQQRCADECRLDRQAIQIQILRAEATSTRKHLDRQRRAIVALTDLVNGDSKG